MKHLLIILLLPLIGKGQYMGDIKEKRNFEFTAGLGAGYNQRHPAMGGFIGESYKRIYAELAVIKPMSNQVTPVFAPFIPKIGYKLSDNVIPYATIKGGGLQVRYNVMKFDVGISDKRWYVLLGVQPTRNIKWEGMGEKGTWLLCSIAGFAKGTREAMQFHWNEVLRKYPDIDQHFWGTNSWKNKTGFAKVIPTFSDGYHLLSFLEVAPLVAAIPLNTHVLKQKNWLWQCIKAGTIDYLFYKMGRWFAYEFVF